MSSLKKQFSDPSKSIFKLGKLFSICAKVIITFSCWVNVPSSFAKEAGSYIASLSLQNSWVDSVFHKLSHRKKIAQLLLVKVKANQGKAYQDSIAKIIKKEGVGGLVFFDGGPLRQANLTNRYQSLAQVPLLIAQDAESGLGMRLDSALLFPYQITLGALQNDTLIYQMGCEVGKQLNRIGVHVNFAPVVDINNNPLNPIIGYRSFGDDPKKVTRKARAYLKGMQEQGILTCLKHFPGHGNTSVDSHKSLPSVLSDYKQLDSVELYPFRELIREGAPSVMMAHLHVPALDNAPGLPSSLSKSVVIEVLKKKLGFHGLIFTDGMTMGAIKENYSCKDASARAIAAGNDILEISENSKKAARAIRKSIRKGLVSQDSVYKSVRKVLLAKYWAGLHMQQHIALKTLVDDLHKPDAMNLNQKLFDQAVTLLKGKELINSLDGAKKTAIICIGANHPTVFQKKLGQKFFNSTSFVLPEHASLDSVLALQKKCQTYPQVLLAIYDPRIRPLSDPPYSLSFMNLLSGLCKISTVTCIFTSPYILQHLPAIENSSALIMSYQSNKEMEIATAKVLMGELEAKGKLPISINQWFKNGNGIE